MQRLAGFLIVIIGLALLLFPSGLPVVSGMFTTYWLRAAGAVIVMLGGFLVWAA